MGRLDTHKRLFLSLLCLGYWLVLWIGTTQAEDVPESIVDDTSTARVIGNPSSFSRDFLKFAEEVGRQKIILAQDLALMRNHAETEKLIEEIASTTHEFTKKSSESILASPKGTRNLLEIKEQVQKHQVSINKLKRLVTFDIDMLSKWEHNWLQLDDELRRWQTIVDQDNRLSTPAESDLSELLLTINSGLEIVNVKSRYLSGLMSEMRTIDENLFALVYQVDTRLKRDLLSGPQQTSPRILSSDFFQQFDAQLWKDLFSSTQSYIQIKLLSLKDPRNHILIILFGGAVLALAFLLRSLKSAHSGFIQIFQQRPLASSYFLTIHCYLMYLVISNSPKPLLNTLSVFLLFVAISRLVNFYLTDERNRSFLKNLILFLGVMIFMQMVNPPDAIIRLVVLLATIFGIIFCLYHAYRMHRVARKSFNFYLSLAIAAFLLLVFGMVAYGFDEVAVQLFVLTVTSCIYAMDTWMLYLLLSCLIGVGVKAISTRIIINNSDAIVKHLQPVLFAICGTLFTLFTLAKWYVFPSEAAAFSAIFSSEWSIGSLSVQPQLIAQTGLIVYATFLVTRASKGILQQTVLPHYDIDTGVQFSIVRLVNYFFILVAFIMLLLLLGIELTKLTIFGSALGIGVGFGLQAIVNNFASGLILLFERPVKVGDTVQIGNDIGEVQHIGLRSTLIKTYNNAEIVVPNSNLITGQVINWSLTEKQIRLDISVGTAYGSDIEKVLKILKECGVNHPLVLSQPSPKALFLRFGESSLDFELRVWLHNYSDRFDVLSEINGDIENEFALNGIKIPFPQRDLHFKSNKNNMEDIVPANK